MIKFPEITLLEKKAFKLHILYSVIEGFVFGLFVLNEFIFIKSLQGSNYMLSYLFMFGVVVLVPTIFVNELLRRTKNKIRMLRVTALITRLPLILIGFFPSSFDASSIGFYHILFLAVFFNYYLASPMIFPIINQVLKNIYSHENFGKLYSYSTSVNRIVAMLATFLFGLLLDFDNFAFRYVYPFVSIFGILSVFLFTRINYNPVLPERFERSLYEKFKFILKRLTDILSGNKSYRDFELGFMLYGFGFMQTVSVITIYLDRELNLSYSDLAFYKNGNLTLTILLLPFFGRLIGSIDPRKFAIVTYSFLGLHILFVGFTSYFDSYFDLFGIKIYYSLLAAYSFLGLFGASMTLLWSIGSAYFCSNDDAAEYQAIHLSLTGLRGIIAPILGIAIYEYFGFNFTFLFSASLIGMAMLLMRWSIKKR